MVTDARQAIRERRTTMGAALFILLLVVCYLAGKAIGIGLAERKNRAEDAGK